MRPRGGTLPEPRECSYEEAAWHCYRCHARGFDDFSWLRDELPVAAPPPPDVVAAANEPIPPGGFEPLDLAQPEHWAAAHYLSKVREVDVLRAAMAAGVGVCRGWGSLRKYQGRVVFPCLDPDTREWLGFVARSVVPDDKIPYLTPRRMPRGRIVWGLEHEALREPGAPLYLVEGAFDALAIFPYGVAPLGKGIQPGQFEVLRDFARRTGRAVVPCLDGDAPEENEALALQLAHWEIPVGGIVRLPPGEDPGKLGWGILDYAGQ